MTSLQDQPQQDRLGQSLLTRHVTMIAIGGIIGAGLFVGSSTTITQVGPAAAITFALAGLIIMLVMRSLGEMAAALPGVRSFADFVRIGLGHWAGYLTGWLYWYFWGVVVAVEALAGAKIIHDWLPMFSTSEIGFALVAVLTLVNLMSARSYGEFEFWFSLIKVVAIGLFIAIAGSWVLGLGHGPGLSGGGVANWTAHGGFAPFGWGKVVAAVASTIFTMCGAEIVTVAAAESAEPGVALSRLALTVTLRLLVFYVIAIGLIVAVVPWTEVVAGHSPFAAALAKMQVPGGALAMTLLILVAVLSCLNSGIYVTSRALFGLASHGDAPQWLVRVNKRQVPARAIVAATLFAYLGLAAEYFSPDKVFSFLIDSSGVTMLLIYMLVAAAQLRLRARLEREDPAALKVRLAGHPWGSVGALAAMGGVLVFKALTPDLSSDLWASLLIAGLFMAGWVVFRRGKTA
ncbi:MAG: amino acid permease [Proteobacteria bacterium]|nr:amino acid permease [Pseudomonadota bacterium]